LICTKGVIKTKRVSYLEYETRTIKHYHANRATFARIAKQGQPMVVRTRKE
jgi:hypothetical protein